MPVRLGLLPSYVFHPVWHGREPDYNASYLSFSPSTVSQLLESHPMMLFGLETGMALFLLTFIVI